MRASQDCGEEEIPPNGKLKKVIPVVQKMPHEANKTIPRIRNISCKKTCDYAGRLQHSSKADFFERVYIHFCLRSDLSTLCYMVNLATSEQAYGREEGEYGEVQPTAMVTKQARERYTANGAKDMTGQTVLKPSPWRYTTRNSDD
ncbi:hypothetical protein llap_5251 [Limosa lapponica baueri]|uniref:Uncharacterized protein n=1 Tax=Limosa lapponica baueri TaxID=1758121 RepID=A0A2I0UEH0_LIMLA|nr:hypothetical protein llap_5251 [Limosa lapponica baueri]